MSLSNTLTPTTMGLNHTDIGNVAVLVLVHIERGEDEGSVQSIHLYLLSI